MVQFGIITTVTGVLPIMVESLSKSSSAEVAEAVGTDGKVAYRHAYSVGTTVNISGTLNLGESDTLPVAGDTLTIDTVDYLIDSVEVAESNRDFVKVTIGASTADDAEIYTEPESSSSSSSA